MNQSAPNRFRQARTSVALVGGASLFCSLILLSAMLAVYWKGLISLGVLFGILAAVLMLHTFAVGFSASRQILKLEQHQLPAESR